MNDKSTKSVSSAVSRSIAGEWETPDELFKELDSKYHFTLDACARPENAKCKKFFTVKEDGLEGSHGILLSAEWTRESSPLGTESRKGSQKEGHDSCYAPACLHGL